MLEKIEDFLSFLSLEKGSPHNTLIAYRNDLTQLARFLNKHDTFELESWEDVDKDRRKTMDEIKRKIDQRK